MKIRSITTFVDPGWPTDKLVLQKAGEFINAARSAITSAGYEVQTTRLATSPFATFLPEGSSLPSIALEMEKAALSQGFDYLSLGPARPENPTSYALIPEAIAVTQNTFFGGLMTSPGGMISLPAVRQCAEIIQQLSTVSADGFANLRFAALANVPAGAPFFPAAYHEGGKPSFAVATEAADLAVQAFSQAGGLQQVRQALVEGMEQHASRLQDICLELASQFGVRFGGIDFSLAPFPEQALSLGAAMERLGLSALGQHGSLAAAAFLVDTMDRAHFTRAGFSGLMLPVLEDAVLAQRAAEGLLSLKDLLLYSAVCGTGLDTVPLPGDTSAEQLAALLLDVAALACRLDKPLTARLMPVPGKRAGDPTNFDFAYFANSRVMSLSTGSLTGKLAGEETFALHRR